MLLFAFRYALSTLRRYPAYAGLNTLGLSLALGCCLLLYWFVRFHRSFEDDQPDQNRIVRLVTELRVGPTNVTYLPGIPAPVGGALRREMPWLERVAMSIGQGNQLVQVLTPGGGRGEKFVEADGMAFVEPGYFAILHYHWLRGSPRSCLTKPYTAVLTRRLAQKYFQQGNPIGRQLRLNNRFVVTITGLLDDIPLPTDRRYELFVSYATIPLTGHFGTPLDSWEGVNWRTYCWVKVRQAGDTARLSRGLPAFRERHAPKLTTHHYHLLPLREVHTTERYNGAISPWLLRVLTAIGGLLLLTAVINFVNMATAQAASRAREIGVQRVIGATRGGIFSLFMLETALLVAGSAGTGLVIAYTLLPALRRWTDTPIPLSLDAPTGLFLLSLTGLLTVAAGVYPAWVLARFRPARVMKGGPGDTATGGLLLRRGLIVGQLAVSMGFILAVGVMWRQTDYWLRADPGFDSAGRLVLPVRGITPTDRDRLRAELRRLPGVREVSYFAQPPAGGELNTQPVFVDNQRAPVDPVLMPADARYVPLFGLPLVIGRNLLASDTARGVLLNETAVRVLGFARPRDALGHRVAIPAEGLPPTPVVGVLRDWSHKGFKNGIDPIVLYPDRRAYGFCALQTTPSFGAEQQRAVRQIWNRYFPHYVFDSYRLDEGMREFYQYEQRQLRLIGLVAGVALLIGCVGLYGLITFVTGRRAREVAVRRTLGATTAQLIWLFGREFLGLLSLAFALAAPVTGWLMSRWLELFTRHIPLSADLFALSFGVVGLITLLTISYQTVRVALTNPAQALRVD